VSGNYHQKEGPSLFMFSKKENYILFGIGIVGILLRWLYLEERAFHHDESLNSIYGLYLYTKPDYILRYNPLLHGPLLYNILPFFYQAFGVSNLTPRILMAVMGTLVMFFPFLWKRRLSSSSIIIAFALLSTSPLFIYYSRFVRHDLLVILPLLLMLLAFQSSSRWKVSLIVFLFFVIACAKENVFVILAQLMGFYTFTFFVLKPKLQWNALKDRLTPLALGFSSGLGLFVLLYTHYFAYLRGFLDGLFRKSFVYWWKQHNMQRIDGPFSFHFLNLSWYESVFLLLIIAHLVHWVLGLKKRNYWLIGMSSCTGLYFLTKFQIFPLLFKIPFDNFLFFFFIFQAVFFTYDRLKNNEPMQAFLGYFFWSSFFTYSFLGEKVPWLSLYILLPGILLLLETYRSYQFDKKGLLLFTVLILFQLRIAFISNWSQAGERDQFLSQVHTTKEYDRLMRKIDEFQMDPLKTQDSLVHVQGMGLWPGFWYLYSTPGVDTSKGLKIEDLKKFDIVIKDIHPQGDKELLKTHDRQLVPLRGWWVPNYNQLSITHYFSYMLNHLPWNSPGAAQINLFIKRQTSKRTFQK
jgi:uncharacterized protein (TIGR03663 family)